MDIAVYSTPATSPSAAKLSENSDRSSNPTRRQALAIGAVAIAFSAAAKPPEPTPEPDDRRFEYFTVRAVGDFMLPHYWDGSRVVVHAHFEPRVGSDVYLECADGARVLRLIAMDADKLTVAQLNPYREMTFWRSEIIRMRWVFPIFEVAHGWEHAQA